MTADQAAEIAVLHADVMALHAAISRRSWHDVEMAANAIRDGRRISFRPHPSLVDVLMDVPEKLHTFTATEVARRNRIRRAALYRPQSEEIE